MDSEYYREGEHLNQTPDIRDDDIDYQAAINHLKWLRGLELTEPQMAEVFEAGFTGEWGAAE